MANAIKRVTTITVLTLGVVALTATNSDAGFFDKIGSAVKKGAETVGSGVKKGVETVGDASSHILGIHEDISGERKQERPHGDNFPRHSRHGKGIIIEQGKRSTPQKPVRGKRSRNVGDMYGWRG